MTRHTQVKKLVTPEQLRAHLDEIGVDIPFDETVDPAGVLASPLAIVDGSAGSG
ncbi:MAG: hypothetical protein R2695_13950 [Acidimicrobiales bacterium]